MLFLDIARHIVDGALCGNALLLFKRLDRATRF